MTTLDQQGPGYRAAQMGRLSAASAVLALLLLLAAGALLAANGSGSAHPTTVVLPVNVEFRGVGLAVGLAAAAVGRSHVPGHRRTRDGLRDAGVVPGPARSPAAASRRRNGRGAGCSAPLAMRGIDLERDPELPAIVPAPGG